MLTQNLFNKKYPITANGKNAKINIYELNTMSSPTDIFLPTQVSVWLPHYFSHNIDI